MSLHPASHFFILIFLAIIIPFGVVGNILSFVTWSMGKRCRHLPVSCYFKPLAIIDTFVLLLPALEYLLGISFGIYLMHTNNVLCKFLSFMRRSNFRLSIWITVALSIEKTCRLYMPLRFKNRPANKRIYVIIAILAALSYSIDIPFLFDRKIQQRDLGFTSVESCSISKDSFSKNVWKYYSWLQIIFLHTGPFIIVTVCNIMILVKMFKRSNNSIGNLNTERQSRRQVQLKYMTYQVFAVCIILCLTNIPYSVFKIIFEDLSIQISRAIFELYFVSSAVLYLNNAINFILYCAIGSDFRQDFKELLACCFCCCRN